MRQSIPLFTALVTVALLGNAGGVQAATGEEVFNKNCAACHSVAEGQNRFGPSLYNVVGRIAGTAPGYAYSHAMHALKSAGFIWSEDKLSAFLASPAAVVPGTKMPFGGLKDKADITAVVDYLKAH